MKLDFSPEIAAALIFFLVGFPFALMFIAVSLGAVAKSIEKLTTEEAREFDTLANKELKEHGS